MFKLDIKIRNDYKMIQLSKILHITALLILAIFVFIIFSGLSSGAMNELGSSLVTVIQGVPMLIRNFALFTFVVSFIAFFSFAFQRQYKKHRSVSISFKNIFKEHKLSSTEELINAFLQLSFVVYLVLNQLLVK